MNTNQLLDIVDENDNVIGQDTKNGKFKKELISRNVAAFLKNEDSNYIIVKRSPDKKTYPNLLDLASCGNVDAGETYQVAMKREIKEELGIDCKPEFLKKVYHQAMWGKNEAKFFTAIFTGVVDSKKIKTNEEHRIFKILSLKELSSLVENSPELFVPFFINDFEAVKDLL